VRSGDLVGQFFVAKRVEVRATSVCQNWDMRERGSYKLTPYRLARYLNILRSTRWRSWFRRCATSRKVAASMVSVELSLTYSFRPHYGPGVDSASGRNEYQEYFLGHKGGRCLGLTNLQRSCADYLEIWEPDPPETLWVSPGL
jgi:hypothetical protein